MAFDTNDLKNVRSQIKEAEARTAEADKAIDDIKARAAESGESPFAGESRATIEAKIKERAEARDELIQLGLLEREIAGDVAPRAGANPGTAGEGPQNRGDLFRQIANRELFAQIRANGGAVDARVLGMKEEAVNRDDAARVFQGRAFDHADGAGLRTPDFKDIMVEQFTRRPRLLDFVTIGTTDTDKIDYVEESPRTDNVDYADYGATVTESEYGFTHKETTVSRLTSFIKATDGQLADAGQTETLLRTRLLSGAQRKLEQEVYNGDGTGAGNAKHLLGFSATSTTTTNGTGLTRLDAILQAVTDIQVASLLNLDAEIVLIHPTDYHQSITEKDNNGNYMLVNPTSRALSPIWGLVPVVTPLVAAGSPWVGSLREYYVWLRSGLELSMSGDVNNDFLTGLKTIKTELRVGSANLRPGQIRRIANFGA